mmetsp:Transcript_69561/g.96721  ORF Transcript_69561/g.96721 Transcript_69561/m.96721 type:complete len:106 (+) Transcript_69561:255-572(+)
MLTDKPKNPTEKIRDYVDKFKAISTNENYINDNSSGEKVQNVSEAAKKFENEKKHILKEFEIIEILGQYKPEAEAMVGTLKKYNFEETFKQCKKLYEECHKEKLI